MSRSFDSLTSHSRPAGLRSWRRWAIVWGIVAVAALVFLLVTWNAFFVYVPPGKHLVIITKDGEPLPPTQVLADKGQKGIQKEVQGEGWHFVLPVVYSTEIEDNTSIPPGKIGIVTARGGEPPKDNRILAEAGERGIQREVLPPGTYRINKHGFEVELVDATEIKPGFVGVERRLLEADPGRAGENATQRGILTKVLQPGLYYLNTKEFEVVKAEVGIFQTTFRYDPNPGRSTAITFNSKGGFPISMDCTIEWEVRPDDMPHLVATYGTRHGVEEKVIQVQAHSIGRDLGIDYEVKQFLQGATRETFQNQFSEQLKTICVKKQVTVKSAFIRNIVIPENYLKPIRDKQIAAETEVTNKAKEETAQSDADVEREKQMVEQRKIEVEARTKQLVAAIDRQAENVATKNQAEIDKIKADYESRIAQIDAERTTALGKAAADVQSLKETATAGIYKLKMDVFKSDDEAFLRYSLAEQLNPKMILRLFHSGPGTFWTNMDGKGFNLMLPATSPPREEPKKTN